MRRQQGRLREVQLREHLSLGAAALTAARAAGFPLAGFVDPAALAAFRGTRRTDQPGADRELEWDWLLHPDGWSRTSSILVCCLSTYRSEPDDLSGPDDPHALIAPFARRNLYGAAVDRMRRVLRSVEETTGLPRGGCRIFCNSRIPEKPLLVASGLAAYGSNSLALSRDLGSELVIAGAILPVPSDDVEGHFLPPMAEPCGTCRRCVRACPVGAIVEPGVVDARRCLQAFAATAIPLDEDLREAWGTRLYGCQTCQSVCPRNRRDVEAPLAPVELGPSLSIRRVLALDQPSLKALFRKTPMGLSWVSPIALRRNALVAAGHRADPVLRPVVQEYATCGIDLLQDAARWALARIRRI